jgi:L-aminopeptidase/D-esterase-like protein
MGGLTDVAGFKVGHAQDLEALTGCTVVLCPPDTVGGVDQRGGAPGTRETDLLHTGHLVNQVTAVLLTGGSAFGLDAAAGVMRYCEESKLGFDAGVTNVPIVPAAVLFDLAIGNPKVRPDAEMGYQACLNATDGEIQEGNVGAGTGASVGKILSMKMATKSGIGTASVDLGGGR